MKQFFGVVVASPEPLLALFRGTKGQGFISAAAFAERMTEKGRVCPDPLPITDEEYSGRECPYPELLKRLMLDGK